jgi:hypothetical protein
MKRKLDFFDISMLCIIVHLCSRGIVWVIKQEEWIFYGIVLVVFLFVVGVYNET